MTRIVNGYEIKPGANLAGANLMMQYLGENPDLSHANLRKSLFWMASLWGGNFTMADLRRANLSYAKLKRAIFIDANLMGANFIGADLYAADLSRCNLKRATLTDARLFNAKLILANLEKAKLINSSLRCVYFTASNLAGANLTNANLEEANLSYSNLSECNFEKSILHGVNFTKTNLYKANFKGAFFSFGPRKFNEPNPYNFVGCVGLEYAIFDDGVKEALIADLEGLKSNGEYVNRLQRYPLFILEKIKGLKADEATASPIDTETITRLTATINRLQNGG